MYAFSMAPCFTPLKQLWKPQIITIIPSFVIAVSVYLSPMAASACVLSIHETKINGATDRTSKEVRHQIPHGTAEIILVRHGETTWNAAGRIQGQLESDLNEVGQKQAVAIAERLAKELKPIAVYSSDLKRAKDTADMIAKKCFAPEVIVVPDLKERHVGILQGLFWEEGKEKQPEAYNAFFSSENDLEIPGGGESFNQLCDRSIAALEKIASQHSGERVIVVTHGGVLRAIYIRISNESSSGKVLNASVNTVHYRNGKWDVKTWSDVSHLGDVGFLERGFNGDAIQN